MEPTTPPILRKLLAKRQISSLFPSSSEFKKASLSTLEDLRKPNLNHPQNKTSSESELDTMDESTFEPAIIKKIRIEGKDCCKNYKFDNSPALTVTTFHTYRKGSFNESEQSDKYRLDEIDLEINEKNSDSLKTCWKINEEIKELLKKFKGELVNENDVFYEQYIFLIRCSFNHTWETNLINLRSNVWCIKCLEKFNRIKQYCEKNQIKLINEFLLPELTLQCDKGHIYKSHYKTYEKKICSICKKIAREKYLQDLKDEEELIFKERERNQSKLFEESKRRVFEEENLNSRKPELEAKEIHEAYKKISIELEEMATSYSNSFISKQNEGICIDFQQCFSIYKMLLMPEDVFSLFLESLELDILKQEFRNLAKKIHPDKNSHPKAAMAFQKLNRIYEQVLKTHPSM